jgi:hypothetical protein
MNFCGSDTTLRVSPECGLSASPQREFILTLGGQEPGVIVRSGGATVTCNGDPLLVNMAKNPPEAWLDFNESVGCSCRKTKEQPEVCL